MRRFFFLLVLTLNFAHANDPRCLSRLGDLISGSATLVETRASDGKPLQILLRNFSETRATVSAIGLKNNTTFTPVTGQFSIAECQMLRSGVKFKLISSGKSLSITQNGNSFNASAGILWSGQFVLK